LASLDHLRQGIHLRGYAQKNPKQEYKREAFQLFSQMLEDIRNDVTKLLMVVRIQNQESVEQASTQPRLTDVNYQHDEMEAVGRENPRGREAAVKPETFVRHGDKVGRNEPCPCGSGKKYKHCHGRLS